VSRAAVLAADPVTEGSRPIARLGRMPDLHAITVRENEGAGRQPGAGAT
jgi:hypothetical protein